jgi:hypothetical protein
MQLQHEFAELISLVEPLADDILRLALTFLSNPINPQAAHEFEKALQEAVREMNREVVQWTYNHIESEDPQSIPLRIRVAGEEYRRKAKSANRHLGTLFGVITLYRFLYEPLERGEKSIFPLEMSLGVAARNATPALAERVGELATRLTQSELLELLERDFDVGWSVGTLRNVTAAVSQGMLPYLHDAQVKQILILLRQAEVSRGRHKIVLAVGRDGIFLPIRNEKTYQEGAVATLSVYDRRGRRLGTVYLGQMPEPHQRTLSDRLTRLIEDVLCRWQGVWPRLAYVTDAGHHPTEYYQKVLRRMEDPRRPAKRLHWIWIVDFYHASEYVGQLAEVLFDDPRAGRAWARKMCKWLKHKPNGVFRVLHSAAKFHAEKRLSKKDEQGYGKAYGYLKNHKQSMDYAEYRRYGLPIGSGVTEAACKTVFTQRFKESGMSWKNESGQIVLDLRVIRLSGLWTEVHQAYLKSLRIVPYATKSNFCDIAMQIAA